MVKQIESITEDLSTFIAGSLSSSDPPVQLVTEYFSLTVLVHNMSDTARDVIKVGQSTVELGGITGDPGGEFGIQVQPIFYLFNSIQNSLMAELFNA